ncbi:MAG TPA: hypothetical protein VEH58_02555 [Dehalococcoidales bacterium]|nr:hypothetical protein [Dehalococcoidales bacterium]
MAKSKQRKFTPRPASSQPVAAPVMATAGSSRKPSQSTIKSAPIEQLKYISTELKVIGILTVVIIAVIIALYFILR